MNRGKRYNQALTQINREETYDLEQALSLAKQIANAKFGETVELAIRLGVNPKHADQMVRGAVVLPYGTGKSVKVLVFAKGEKEKEALEAGADFVGAEDLVDKINKGWLEFDKAIATPDIMSMVGKLGKILGPRGLMPNPKVGTVTFDIRKAVRDIKAGKIEFKVDKAGILHVSIGKASFPIEHLIENAKTLLETVIKAKPASSKGQYLKSITTSATMGPGIRINIQSVSNLFRK